MTEIQRLANLAKQSFNLSVAVEAFRPEGVAILMKSGLILSGHSYERVNAANDALRSLKEVYNSRQPESLDDFTIMTAVVIVEPKTRKQKEFFKPSNILITTLQKALPVDENAMLYVASSQSMYVSPPIQTSIKLAKNLTLDLS
jgi:hypothetical protein